MKKISNLFQGHFKRLLDSRGRLSIPHEFMENLGERFRDVLVITNHHDSCLWAFPINEWMRIKEKAARLPLFNEAATTYLRYFMASAVECRIDSEGKITIPPDLLEIAGIQKKIVLAGTGKNIEIWDEDNWIKENDLTRKDLQELRASFQKQFNEDFFVD